MLMNFVYVASPNLGGEGDAPADDEGYVEKTARTRGRVSGTKTASGKTMLLQNPHLSWNTNYSTYYEAHLVAPGFEVYGATQIGLPIVRLPSTSRWASPTPSTAWSAPRPTS